MSVPTSRTSTNAEILVDYQRCTACGICVEVCKGGPLYLADGQLKFDQTRGFGCIACAACAAFCPTDAIRISGAIFSPRTLPSCPRLQPARITLHYMPCLLRAEAPVISSSDRSNRRSLIASWRGPSPPRWVSLPPMWVSWFSAPPPRFQH